MGRSNTDSYYDICVEFRPKMVPYNIVFTKSAGAGAKCDHPKIGVCNNIWMCEVGACDAKKGCNPPLLYTKMATNI